MMTKRRLTRYVFWGIISILLLVFGTTWHFLSTLETPYLMVGVLNHDNAYRFPPKPVFWFYLRYVRGPKLDDPKELNLLHFTLNGCHERLPHDKTCVQVIDWLLASGHDINVRSNDTFGFSPIHGAVLACSKESVKYLIDRGADVNALATGEKFKGMTPLRLIDEFKSPCGDMNEIAQMLMRRGGHK